MKNYCRYISGYCLGAILLLPVLAMIVLQLGQAYIQSTREERLEREKLIQVVVPAKEIIWEEEGKELWVGDKMFDVSSYIIKDGNYVLTGVFDEEETEVADSLLHSFFGENGTSFLHLLLLLQCFSIAFILLGLTNLTGLKAKTISFYFSLFPSPAYLVLGPPPRQ